MSDKKVLAKPVYIGGELVEAGTELTEAQAQQVKNPKAFKADPTFEEKIAAAQAEYEKLLAERDADSGSVDKEAVKDDRAENGAALARAAKTAGSKAAPQG